MGTKHIAALVAMISAAAPALAQDRNQPWDRNQPMPSTVMFYYSIPLDARSPKEQAPAFGFAVQGKSYRYALDNQMMSRFDMGTVMGLEVKWLVAGAVAAGAAAAAGSSSSSRQQSQQASQNTQQQQQAAADGTSGGSSSTPCPPTPEVCPQR